MARNATGVDGKPVDDNESKELLNSDDRNRIINEVIRDVSARQVQVAALNAEIRRIKQTRIKGDLGMKIGDFNAVMRLANLEHDDRDKFLDTLRETFMALGHGEQLDFLSAQQPAEAAAAA